RAGSAISGIKRVNLAVFGRDVEDADLLTPTAAIRIGAHDDGGAGLQCLALEAVDERLRNADSLALYQRRLTVRARGPDDQVHVRVYPVEARDRAFDEDLLRRVEHRLAMVGGSGGAQERRRGENRSSGCQTLHVETSAMMRNSIIEIAPSNYTLETGWAA